ncbi:matrixin family metalloprotease [Methanosarcina horonobensis]
MEACYLRFNSDYSWSTSGESGKYDVQNIDTHEFGHWLSLGDTSNTEATMYKYANLGETKKRSLTSDDIAGIRSIYP